MGISTATALAIGVLAKLIADETKAWLPKIVEHLVRRAVKKLPDNERERFDEEWRADLDETPGDLGKLFAALGFQFAVLKMNAELPSTVERLRNIALKARRTILENASLGPAIRGFCLFALLVAVPFLLEQILRAHSGPIKVNDSFWHDVLAYSGFGIVVLSLVGFLVMLALVIPQTYLISKWLILAEREMNRLLRTGNLIEARATALLLHDIYEGNVATAQTRIHREIENGGKPFIAAGLRNLLDFDTFDATKGFPRGAGVAWFPLLMAVKLHSHPRQILMVRPDKKVMENWDVIDELTKDK